MATETQLVFTTFPDEDTARQLADRLVENRLAACVTLLPKAHSVYFWEGKVQHQQEWLGLIKTTTERYADLERQLLQWHPYETPELIAVDIAAGSPDYLRWLQGQCG